MLAQCRAWEKSPVDIRSRRQTKGPCVSSVWERKAATTGAVKSAAALVRAGWFSYFWQNTVAGVAVLLW